LRFKGTIALVVVALLAGSLSAGAQQADHATGFRTKIKAKYLERRDRFLRRTKDLYFALGCKILASEAGILPLTSSESYLAFIGDQTIVDTKDESVRLPCRKVWSALHDRVNATTTGGTLKQQRLRDARLPKHLPNGEALEIGTEVSELMLRDHC